MDSLNNLRQMTVYQQLMGQSRLEGEDFQRAIEQMSRLRDVAFSLGARDGLMRVVARGDELMRLGLRPRDEARLHYLLSDVWEKLRLLRVRDGGSVWDWEQPEIERELIHLRRALHRDALKDLSTRQVCQVLTNLAALLNHVGRFSEAQELWDRAVSFMPDFALARGKRGYGLTHYAHVLYDRSHVEKFLKKARTDLMEAVHGPGLGADAHAHFTERLEWVDASYPLARKGRSMALFAYTPGASSDEITYRRWCLEHRLFLNPLNDLGPYPAAMRDELVVPAVVRSGDGGASMQGFFNQAKQSYVSARYMYYEGVTAREPHFSDRDVLLFDTLDFPSYSLAAERVKAAFTMAMGAFDRIAYFLNFYLDLSVPEHRLTFRTFWYEMQRREDGLMEVFSERKNWPLRGLFWLSKDLYEEEPGFDESIEPDGAETAELRYQAERRYLKLHEDFHQGAGTDGDAPLPARCADSLAMSVHRGEFEARTLRTLKKVRSALMCLGLAIHQEERRRGKKYHRTDPDLPSVSLSILDDSWKV
jgi:hypothetical protein